MIDSFAPGLLGRLPEPPRKIALVKAARIGDFICATPAFRALADAEITMITLPILRNLAERSPHLDRYVTFPGYPGLAEQFFDARRAAQFFLEMQAEQFDLAVQLQGSGVYSNPFMLMLSARVTAPQPHPEQPMLARMRPHAQRRHACANRWVIGRGTECGMLAMDIRRVVSGQGYCPRRTPV